MRLLREITDKDIGIDLGLDTITYHVRKAARAIVFDNNNKIALLAVSNGNYRKLPGGGIEFGEDIPEALIREVREEVGAEIEIKGEVGCIIEYRNEFKQLQISYCYIANIVGELYAPSFTEFEIKNGFELEWHNAKEAVKLLNEEQPQNYVGKFIVNRDCAFLEEALKQVGYEN